MPIKKLARSTCLPTTSTFICLLAALLGYCCGIVSYPLLFPAEIAKRISYSTSTKSALRGGVDNQNDHFPLRSPPSTSLKKFSQVTSQNCAKCADNAKDLFTRLARKHRPTKFFPYLHTGYHRFYKNILSDFHHKNIRLLEIGLDTGNGSAQSFGKNFSLVLSFLA